MKKLVFILITLLLLIGLTACAKTPTSGEINHAYISGVQYVSKDGSKQSFYLFQFQGILLQVPIDTTSFSVYVKGYNIEVTNIVINDDATLSCDWVEQK
jgi:hypothetical protein